MEVYRWSTKVEYVLLSDHSANIVDLYLTAQSAGNRCVFLRMGDVLIVSVDPMATHPGLVTSFLSTNPSLSFTGGESAEELLNILEVRCGVPRCDFDAGVVTFASSEAIIAVDSNFFKDTLYRPEQPEVRLVTESLLVGI